MKKLIVAIFAVVLFAASSARADIPNTTSTTQICKSGPAVAACPEGTQSNIGVAYANNGSLTTNSIANPSNNYNSVATGQNTNQSVVPQLNHTDSVAISPSFSSGDSVAYRGNSTNTTGSVAYGGSAATSQSVVH